MADKELRLLGPQPAYRVLARKYRPQSFDDLIGQEAMVRTLSNAFDTGRLPHAWMLTGVRGVGKTTTARILARALNYEVPGKITCPTIHMSDYGTHCEAIIEGRHIDVLEMDAASHTGINDIREIIDAVRYTPMSGRYKVYVIDEVHMLSTAAFNGLLKTLEEPPEHVKFIFATTEIRKVPITVLSRCQRFDLRRIDIEALCAHLTKIATAEAVTLAPEAALLIARAAEGSVRDGLSLLDQAIASGSGAVEAETVRQMLGLTDRLRVYDLLEALMRGDAQRALALFAAHYQDGADPAILVGELAEAVHALTRQKIAGSVHSADAAPEAERQRVQALAQGLSHAVLSRAWQMLLKGLSEVQSAPRPASAAEMLLVRLCHVAEWPSPEELVKRLATADDGVRAVPREGIVAPLAPLISSLSPAPNLHPAPPLSPGPARSALNPSGSARSLPRLVSEQAEPILADPGAQRNIEKRVDLQRFDDLVALVQFKRDIKLKTALERSVHLVHFERGRIELRIEGSEASWLIPDLQKKLHEWTSERWLVTLSQAEGALTLYDQAQAQKQMLVDDVRAHPSVAAVLARFPGAEIVDVRMQDSVSPDPHDSNDNADDT